MKRKKVLKISGICFVIIIAMTFSTYAIATSSNFKKKNDYQIAAEKNIPISKVDKEENFKYTKFDSDIESKDNNTTKIEKETFTDLKTNIYNKMLNTIDYLNNVELTLETTMFGNGVTTISYQTDIDSGSAYEAVLEDGILKSETYSTSGKYNLIYVDNTVKTYNQQYLASYKRSDTPYVPLSERIVTEEDGIPCFIYRRNITNCPLASYSLVPQEITFSYLKDFNKWQISNDNIKYLGRNCIKITGDTTPYVSSKHNAKTFTMIVDSDTGILMSFEAINNGTVTQYIHVKDCSFNTKAAIKQFDINNYSSYTEVYN